MECLWCAREFVRQPRQRTVFCSTACANARHRNQKHGLSKAFEKPYPPKQPIEPAPIPLILWCPACHERHIDEGEQATTPHRTHACQSCGVLWAPAVVPTVGVRFLPGCKNGGES